MNELRRLFLNANIMTTFALSVIELFFYFLIFCFLRLIIAHIYDIIKYILYNNYYNFIIIRIKNMFKNKEYVLTVYKEGSFTNAAEKLFVSQPSLSASVKRIEEKVTAQIFDRSTTPISLTEVGKAYVKYALEIEEKERDFERFISDHSNLLTGKIRIGGSSFFSSFVLPKMIADFNEKHEKIQFEVFEDSTKNLLKKLSEGQLDLVIDNAIINEENVISEVYQSETLLLAVPKRLEINEKIKKYRMSADDVKNGKHLERERGVDLSNFNEQPFILLNHENDTGKRAEKLFAKHGVTPKIIFHLDQQITAYNISCTGMGISFVSDTLIKNIAASPDLYYYAIDDRTTVRKVYFYRKKNHYLSYACKKFIEYNM